MREHIDADRAKKEEKIMKKKAEEEAKRREEEELRSKEEERLRREKKAQRKKEKARKEAEFRAEMRKDMSIQLAIQMNEMHDKYFASWQHSGATLIGVRSSDKEKEQVIYEPGHSASEYSDDGSEVSVTQELSAKTRKLCLSEKRKRGPESVFEGYPPMEREPKRTPKRGSAKPAQLTGRMTRAKNKKYVGLSPISAKKRTPVKTPLWKRKTKTPAKKTSPGTHGTSATKGALARLRYLNAELKRLKDLDAMELQRICKEEGIQYDKKVYAIFEIAEHRTELALGNEESQKGDVIQITESDVVENTADEQAKGNE
ncbi:hypothetical protein CBR_g57011 [Chara braunii]|uniref:Uncharacterized protein n=1 Tax=Chara braunii TaxID=69332 RepID=A0A388MDW9_CHABU|nr:hypothetical protein CBR_g57011 [Chara braunii]|eukprot:GBG92768.1 hypothetical protein CBR_g57011 [Chara braunii]